MRPMCSSLAFAFLALASILPAQGLKNGWHEDTKTGFKLKVPEKWECVPVSVDEKWIVAKYLGDRAVQVKKGEFWDERKPQMRVIVFSDEARKIKPAEVKVTSESESRALIEAREAEIPYKDYKDYMKRNGQEGGFYFDKEKETKIGEVPCWQYEIKFEKLTTPRHAVTWVFRGDAADYAIEFEVLEDHWAKYQPLFLEALRSFKLIKRDSANVGSGGTTGSGRSNVTDSTGGKTRDDWKALTVKERIDRRKSIEDSRFQRAKEKLPPGWTVKNSKNFLVLTHSDQKTTDKIVEAAESCRNWLDKNLGGISDEYAMKAVIRICANYDEYNAYARGSDDTTFSGNREIVTFKDANMGSRRSGFDRVFRGLLMQYLDDKDDLIIGYAPPWAIYGLGEAVSAALPEGGTLKLGADQWEADIMREAQKAGTKTTAKQIMEAPIMKLFESPAGMVLAGRLVRHFLASKKDFMVNYLKASIEAAADLTKDQKVSFGEAKTEEEEEARLKERKDAGQKRFSEMVQKVHDKVCKWSDKEWQALDAAAAAAK
jgi:hypothetical protein